MPFVIAEAKVRAETASAINALHRAIENIDELPDTLPIAVTAHTGLIDGEFRAAGRDEIDEFLSHDGKQRFGERPAVLILRIRKQTPAQRIRSGNAALQNRSRGRKGTQSLKLRDSTQPP